MVYEGLIFGFSLKIGSSLKGFSSCSSFFRFLFHSKLQRNGFVVLTERKKREEERFFCVVSGEWKGHVANWVIREF